LTIPYEPVDIKYANTDNRFLVKDNDGTTYNFGGDDMFELSGTPGTALNATSWKCRNIISASKKDTIFSPIIKRIPARTCPSGRAICGIR